MLLRMQTQYSKERQTLTSRFEFVRPSTSIGRGAEGEGHSACLQPLMVRHFVLLHLFLISG